MFRRLLFFITCRSSCCRDGKAEAPSAPLEKSPCCGCPAARVSSQACAVAQSRCCAERVAAEASDGDSTDPSRAGVCSFFGIAKSACPYCPKADAASDAPVLRPRLSEAELSRWRPHAAPAALTASHGRGLWPLADRTWAYRHWQKSSASCRCSTLD